MADVTPPEVDPKASILISTKKMLQIAADDDSFDTDIILHINSVFSILQQIGLGLTDEEFVVEDETQLWEQAVTSQKNLNMIKSYMYLKVRTMFDPAASGFVTDSFERQIKEFEWRIMVAASSTPNLSES